MPGESALILPVIMCGGSGTRLWPASRESMPKQFITL
ncbi:MAG: sugar phosphate nucleotidyltransferase, partial [Hyphomicrobiales bacterium]